MANVQISGKTGKALTFLALTLYMSSPVNAQGTKEKKVGPASVVVPVPETPAARSATRESDDETPVAKTEEGDTEHLTGDWGGVRSKLSASGVDLGVVYKFDHGSATYKAENVDSESKRYSLGNLDVRLSLDTEKMGAWKGGSFFFYGIFADGDSPDSYVGDAQGTSNIAVGEWTSRLYEAWYQHDFGDGFASLLVGLHDLNSEFYVTDSSGIFLNSGFGIGADMSQTGAQGPSVFPVTAPSIRLRIDPSENFYAQAAAFNAIAGDLNYPKGTHARFSPGDDGLLIIGEGGWVRTAAPAKEGEESEILGKVAVGTWSYSNTPDNYGNLDEDPEAPASNKSSGTYLLVDQAVTENIAAFARYGISTNKDLDVGSNLAAGVVFKGLIPTRDEDQLGIGLTSIAATDKYKENNAEAQDRETAYEITYRANVCRGVVLQPNFQYVDQPSFVKSASATAIGGRLEINF